MKALLIIAILYGLVGIVFGSILVSSENLNGWRFIGPGIAVAAVVVLGVLVCKD